VELVVGEAAVAWAVGVEGVEGVEAVEAVVGSQEGVSR
jgi:hypothetical protein